MTNEVFNLNKPSAFGFEGNCETEATDVDATFNGVSLSRQILIAARTKSASKVLGLLQEEWCFDYSVPYIEMIVE